VNIAEMKRITLKFIEPWSTGDVDALDELCAPEYRLGENDPLETLKQGILFYRRVLPDLTGTVDEMIAEGDKIAYHWTMRGTHQGEFDGIAPTGKPVTMTGTTILHFANGKIVHDSFESSSPSLKEQVT
jgi:predicted ester cyclase